MPRKKHTPEQVINKLREAEVVLAQGRTVAEASRQIGVTEQTFYRWRNEYGGLRIDQVKRFKQLESENTRLKRAVADLTLDKQILKEAAEGNFWARPVVASAQSMSEWSSVSRSVEPAERSISPGPLSGMNPCRLRTSRSSLPTSWSWQAGTAGTATAGSPLSSDIVVGG